MRSEGLLPYEFAEETGVCGEQGWMDRHHVLSLILLNVAGGD
jgi:hypothetical protein